MVKVSPWPASDVSVPDKVAPAVPLSSPTRSLVLDVGGMKCAGCVRAVEKQLQACEGVLSATVNLVTEVAVVETIADGAVDPTLLSDRLTQAGFPAQLRNHSEDADAGLADWLARKQQENRVQAGRLAIALLLLALSTLGHLRHVDGWAVPVLSDLWFHGLLATGTLLFPARSILVEGWQGLRHGTPNMNTLVALGAMSAYLASGVALIWPHLGWECFFDEPVMLLSFILLGRTLEQRARFRATDALRSLMALQPTKARLIPTPGADGATQSGVEIPANVVQVGEWLQVLPGETIPADGVIETGQTTVNEAMLTGESMPVEKQPGDHVVAGTLNQTGAITLKVTNTGKDTVLAQMIRLVETAQSRKAPIQRLADVVAGYFTYGVLTVALLTFLFWYFFGTVRFPEVLSNGLGHGHISHLMSGDVDAHPGAIVSPLLLSLKRAIAVLVVACPCALGLATPTAILVGSGRGAEQGLLVRGGDVLENLSRVDRVVFDKTGTLTQGAPTVTQCQGIDENWTPTDLLTLAAAVEQGTQHPLAIAVRQAARREGLDLPPATDFQTQPGLGVAATVIWADRPQRVWIGRGEWLTQQGIPLTKEAEAMMAHLSPAETAVYVAIADRVLGLLAVTDPIRPEAAATVQALQAQGIIVQLLSGDRAAVAQAIAATVGIPADQVIAGVLPAEKVRHIADLQAAGHRVALVGDGINDAPALAQATVGISLSSGTDIATEAADVVLMGDRLSGVVDALVLGRQTVAKIQQNLAWAFAYNLVAIPAAAGLFLPTLGFTLSPAIAGGLMAFSSVTVVINSLLLKTHHLAE